MDGVLQVEEEPSIEYLMRLEGALSSVCIYVSLSVCLIPHYCTTDLEFFSQFFISAGDFVIRCLIPKGILSYIQM
jgi:hypothetical protein